jgi:hypothetical protein
MQASRRPVWSLESRAVRSHQLRTAMSEVALEADIRGHDKSDVNDPERTSRLLWPRCRNQNICNGQIG